VLLKKISFSIAAVLLLTGCGGAVKVAPTPSATPSSANPIPKLVIPTDCLKAGMNEALSQIVPEAKYIPTKWQPAPGTELANFLDNGGLACSYGLQSAEVGITAKWVDDSKGLFENRIAGWVAEGYVKTELPDTKGAEAYFLLKKQSPTQEFHVWSLNVKYHQTWLQLNCTAFAQTLDAGLPLFKAMISQ
jgi:hypothetical protein